MFNPTVIAIPLFALMIGIEALIARRRDRDFYSGYDAFTNILIGFVSVAFGGLFGLGIGLVYTFLYELSPLKLPTDAWWSWTVLFFLDDFAYYWFHRVSHETRLFWNFHVVHHSSQHYNLSVAVRQSWFSGLLHWIFYAPIMLLGFAPWMLLITHGFNLIYQFWIHTRLIDKLGWFEWIFNTPSHHRVHHGVNDAYLDKNYAGVFIIWDRMFGTFVPETEEPRYGIIKPIASHNPLWINLHAWFEMFDAMKRRETAVGKFRCIFGSPNLDRT